MTTLITLVAIVATIATGRADAATEPFTLGPPPSDGPVVVHASFHLHDLNEIDERTETFGFSGVLTLTWHDEREVFDRAVVGVDEKVFQGGYQFNEISTGWYPQAFLVNASGGYDKQAVLLRVGADGTLTLTETVTAMAKAELDMHRFPLDEQRLHAVFEILGVDEREVVLQLASEAGPAVSSTARLPQWSVEGIDGAIERRERPYAGRERVASAFVVTVDVERRAFFVTRLVILPLVVIVLLSFSVFWMDRSLLADRLSISFIGILTGVAYQIVLADFLPQISYFTLIHGIINLSFFTMCATVVVNLIVGTLDRHGKSDAGDRFDRRCRWIFPAVYFGLMTVELFVALLFF